MAIRTETAGVRAPETARPGARTMGFGPRLRAWSALVRFGLRRQAGPRQLVWISLSLLMITTLMIALNTIGNRWGMHQWRYPRGSGPSLAEWLMIIQALPLNSVAGSQVAAITGAGRALLDQSGFHVFTTWIVSSVFLSFLLPVWCLSFATDALGAERENRTLIWLLCRPLSRPGIFLARYVSLIPPALVFNVGGFGLLCLAAGPPGWLAFRLFWPAVITGTLAFCSLFHLMGVAFRRAAVVAIAYSFFLETILGNMPGQMKRISLGFYVRCMMFESAGRFGFHPEKPSVYQPVSAAVALFALLTVTLAGLAIGMWLFTRSEYHELN